MLLRSPLTRLWSVTCRTDPLGLRDLLGLCSLIPCPLASGALIEEGELTSSGCGLCQALAHLTEFLEQPCEVGVTLSLTQRFREAESSGANSRSSGQKPQAALLALTPTGLCLPESAGSHVPSC